MSFVRPIDAVTADDDALARLLEDAHLVTLLPALAQLTGDLTILREGLRPDPQRLRDPEGPLTPSQVAEARGVAREALARYRDGGCVAAPEPTDDELRRLMEFVVGEPLPDAYLPLLAEELALSGRDLRAPDWRLDEIAPGRDFSVAVIGAGMSGIVAAHRLQQAGVEYTVFEKNPEVGGTWFENTYPGCRVDVPNHLYSYSFAQKHDWPQHHSPKDVLLDYFVECVDHFGLRNHISFDTEVRRVAFDDDRHRWVLDLETPEGSRTVEANTVISAVGQLSRPRMPDIEGLDTFAGHLFHSASWDHDVDLSGRRVAVIGTGASAAQFVPIIAEDVAQLIVFQRTPNWYFPAPDYHNDVPEGLRWVFGHVPYAYRWYRFWQFWRGSEGALPAAVVDPEWQPQDRSVSALNDELRELLTEWLRLQYHDRPDLLAKVIPDYPPISKRVLVDNGAWAQALKADHVHLVTDDIVRITPTSVVTAGGAHHEVDVIICATGFRAADFLMPMAVTGRNGIDLHEQWGGDARAHLGVTIPGFPNLFCLYGPNTNIVVNGSIIYFSECEVHYVLSCLRMLFESGHAALDCRRKVHDAYNDRIDAANRRMVWGAADVNSWYKNATGRVAQNWPFSLLEYWEQTRAVDPADYELLAGAGG